MAEPSILVGVKKVLGIEADQTEFDTDVLMHVNSVFAVLNQLGIGPTEGFVIEDDQATWDQFLGTDLRLSLVKTYTYLKVRLIFDPPTGSYHLVNSLNEQVKELEWRLNVKREGDSWTDPTPPQTDPDLVQYVPIPVNDFWNAE